MTQETEKEVAYQPVMVAKVMEEAGYRSAAFGLGLSKGVTTPFRDYGDLPDNTRDQLDRLTARLAPMDGGHNKFLESMVMWLDVTAPRFWWQEADTYRLSTKQSACFSEDTEALTDKGWFLFKDVPENAKFATLNIDTKTLEYQASTERMVFGYSKPMVHILNKKIDLLVTQEHDLIVCMKHSEWNIFKKVKAVKAVNKKIFIPKIGDWRDGDPSQIFHVPEENYIWDTGSRECVKNWPELNLDSKKWAWFLGFYLAEGSCEKAKRNYNVSVCQNDDNPCITMIEECLKSFPFKVHKTDMKRNTSSGCKHYRWIISNKQFYNIFSGLGKVLNKHIPEYVFSWSKELQMEVWKGLFAGDGTKYSGIYSTVSKQLADDVQRLLRNIGISSNITKREMKYPRHDVYCVSPHKTRMFSTSKGNIFLEDYVGKVYCASVPNGTLYTRRNGKAIWSGNSTMHTLNKDVLWSGVLGITTIRAMFEPGSCDERTASKIYDMVNAGTPLEHVKSVLPEGFLQRREWCMSYKTLKNIHSQRKNHKLPHWRMFLEQVLKGISHPEFVTDAHEAVR